MIYLLFIGILILFFVSFFLFQKNILNPSVILCSVFLVSLFFTILNIKNWGITLHLNTTVIILETIIVFILGNSLVYLLPKQYKVFTEEENIEIEIPSFKIILIIDIILLVLLYKYFQEVYKLSLIGGNPGGYKLMLAYARNAKLNFYNVNRIFTYSIYLTKSISYVCFFIFSYINIFKKFNFKNIFLLSPIIIYCGFIILSTGRTDFIYLFVYMLVTFFILYQQKYNFDSRIIKKIIIYGVLTLIIFFVIFSLAGLFTGKTQSKSIYDMISLYAGSSIPALDVYLNSPKFSNNYFGENTLFLVYNILRKFGYDIPNLYAPYESDMIPIKDTYILSTN
ncbi:MAG: O-antigen polymerase [Fusobacterium sp.]|uniref:O-antigen polymerase n=1 Tax=Fusobacterium sp. TaxID=68766 RepID=UPI002A75CAA3|nr:O-antigen polymerase [Fusobacterium sp.]MDY2980864.1 O-antigen polymerase [Fusobacterium sp.]